MPAMLDDPGAPAIYRQSGSSPFPNPHDANPALPLDVYPRQVTLRDRVTAATIVPFSSQHQVPASLSAYLAEQLNKEIDGGDTYPMMETMSDEKFASYWFQNFGAVMLLGSIESANEVVEGKNWATECLGSYYIKPNYPGRSSHVCNAGFLVTDAARGRGVGRLMGESYLEWAPRLGYTYSVFNLVYETNVASCRIWDALGFKRIGRVKGAGNLKSYPDKYIDAIIYGRDLGPDGSDFVSEERFDKIKFYLKHREYPSGADRAEKSRLRSSATHYKLLPDEDKLMLRGKEVISDPQKQYEISRNLHKQQHAGINKTTAMIAEKYHWVRIKETVSLVIKNCFECKELGKVPVVKPADPQIQPQPYRSDIPAPQRKSNVSAAGSILSMPKQEQGRISPQPPVQHAFQQNHSFQEQPESKLQTHTHSAQLQHAFQHQHHAHNSTSVSPQVLNRILPSPSSPSHTIPHAHPAISHHQQYPPQMQHRQHQNGNENQRQDGDAETDTDYLPLDPQIMDYKYTPPPPPDEHGQMHDGGNEHFEQHDHAETDSFQAMLGDHERDLNVDVNVDVDVGVDVNGEDDADLDDMLVDQGEDEDINVEVTEAQEIDSGVGDEVVLVRWGADLGRAVADTGLMKSAMLGKEGDEHVDGLGSEHLR